MQHIHVFKVNLQEAFEGSREGYGEFEARFRDGFNDAYYDQRCAAESKPRIKAIEPTDYFVKYFF